MHSDSQVQPQETLPKKTLSMQTLYAWVGILLPIAATIYLYRRSLRIYFLRDDFAWLGLRLSIFSPGDLWQALFAPMAQGTIRTLSERLFFLVFESLFGLEPLPMRLFAFLTLAAAQGLLVLIVRRLSGSWVSGALAALFFGVNFGTATAISWISSYNQILLSALLLMAFYAFLRYAESYQPRWLIATWVAYLLSFGALESAIVFPGILLAYCLLIRRDLWRKTVPFFVPALAFAFAHLKLIPKETRPEAYRMYFDLSMFESLGVYWQWMLGSPKLAELVPDSSALISPAFLTVSLASLGTLLWASFRRNALPLFYLLFSLALIGPMLPLREHRSDYYLASASLGFAMFLGSVPTLWRAWAGWAGYWLSLPVLLLYLYPSWLVQQATINWYLETSFPVRTLMRGAEQASRLHPDKLILLSKVPAEVYWNSMDQDAFRLVGASRVRLAPGQGPAESKFLVAPAAARVAFTKESVLVYAFEDRYLKDVTRQWERGPALALAGGLSPYVLSSEPSFAEQFGEGWYAPDQGRRWMGRQAKVRLGGPFAANAKLTIEAFCPDTVFDSAAQPLQLAIVLNGRPPLLRSIPKGSFTLSIPLPEDLRQIRELDVQLRSSHSVRLAQESRDLSLLFGSIGVR